MLDTLEALQKPDGFYPEDSSVLQIRAANGGVVILASPLATRFQSLLGTTSWSNISAPTVNTNENNQNDHMLTENLLSNYSISSLL
uniref:Uncharacterized protein n=1 Tax=Peronospora matthiolae TaxID=2874970 RepID=A0AAV1T752_9STRA